MTLIDVSASIGVVALLEPDASDRTEDSSERSVRADTDEASGLCTLSRKGGSLKDVGNTWRHGSGLQRWRSISKYGKQK